MVNGQEPLALWGGLKEEIIMKAYLQDLMDYNYAKSLKLRHYIGTLDLLERRKRYEYTSSRVEEEKGTQNCCCGDADESTAHIVGKRELYMKEQEA